jgi:haloalkane dehalogenase
VRRLVVLNSWMWSFEGDAHIERGARLLGGGLGRWLYRSFNASLRMITPSAYADRKKLTKRIPDLWERRAALADLPALIVWGTKDPAFLHRYLARWREALPRAAVLELPVGHWPQEEAPEEVARAVGEFLAARS